MCVGVEGVVSVWGWRGQLVCVWVEGAVSVCVGGGGS